MRKSAIVWTIPVLLVLVGCQPVRKTGLPAPTRLASQTPAARASATVVQPSQTAAPTTLPSQTATPGTAHSRETPLISPTSTLPVRPTGTASEPPVSVPGFTPMPIADTLAGLMVCMKGSLYVFKDSSQPMPIAPCDALFSSDLRYAAFHGNTPIEIWLLDLTSGEKTNLTRNYESDYPQEVYSTIGPWSPDSRTLYYAEGRDYWLKDIWSVDIASGQRRDLTNTPIRDETNLRYWPGPGMLLFHSHGKTEDPGPFGGGHLTSMLLNGAGYQVLLDDMDSDPPVISPDGRTLALRGGYLYHWGTGLEQLKFTVATITATERIALIAPAWSPDSGSIAWSLGVYPQGIDGFGVIDLSSVELRVFHLYQSHRMGEGTPGAPVWSPDGRWLAFDIADIGEWPSLWVARADGSEEKFIGPGQHPVWSPDSQWLAYEGIIESGESVLFENLVVETGAWQPRRIGLPGDADLANWLDPAAITGWIEMGAIDLNTEDAVWGSQFVVTQAGINIRVHASPGNDTPVEALLNPGDGFQIAGWPEYMDGYQWWKIRTPDGVEGWVVDNPAWYRRR